MEGVTLSHQPIPVFPTSGPMCSPYIYTHTFPSPNQMRILSPTLAPATPVKVEWKG